MESFLSDVWDAVRPALLTAITTLIPILATVLTAKIVLFLKVQKDGELSASLYRSIENGLKVAFARKLANGGMPATAIPGDVVKQTVDYVKANNAKAVQGLGQTDKKLVDKIVARAPEAKAAVVEVTARVQAAV